MNFDDINETEEVIATVANVYWPGSVIHFYEKRLNWIAPINENHNAMPTVEGTDVDLMNRQPETILCI